MPIALDEELAAWERCSDGVRVLNEGLKALLSMPPPIVRNDEERARVRQMATEMRMIADMFDTLAKP